MNKPVLLLLLLLALSAQQVSAAIAKKKILTFYQDPPVVANGTLDADYRYYTYYATLRSSKGGATVGVLYGTTVIHDKLINNAVSVSSLADIS